MSIQIDAEFRDYLSALKPEEYKTLESSILEVGCESPLILWGDVLIDGHNRHKICTEHDLPFETEQKAFPNRDAVIDWMLVNQLGRRNLSPDDFRLFVGRLYNSRKNAQGAPEGNNNRSIQTRQNDGIEPKPTAEAIATEHGTSARTVERAGKQAEAIDTKAVPELKEAVRNHEVPVSAAAAVAELPKDEQVAVVKAGAEAVKEKAVEVKAEKKPRKTAQKKTQKSLMLDFLRCVESLSQLNGKTTPPLIIKNLDEKHRARLESEIDSALILLTETRKTL